MTKTLDAAILPFLSATEETPDTPPDGVWLDGLGGLGELKEAIGSADSRAEVVHSSTDKKKSSSPLITLTYGQFREILPPIRLAPWLLVVDPNRFIEATLADLAVYVAAENKGSRHWIKDLLEEKLRQLEKCGLKVEIEEVQ